MSYSTIAACVADVAFTNRIKAAVAQEDGDPTSELTRLYWDVASHSDIEAAYASALAGDNPNPGGDESVITDGMILAAVQAELPPAP